MPYSVRKCEKCGNDHRPQKEPYTTCGPCRRQAKIAARRTAPEPPPVDGARWVQLTRGKFALVDEADFARVSRFNWSHFRAKSGCEYAVRQVSGGTVFMHRELLGLGPEVEVDHQNRNGLDNRRQNLREATVAQNMANKLHRNRSGFKGVRWDARRGWYASITIDGVHVHLGVWTTDHDAARAYDAAARKRHGAFARLNFPEPGELSARPEGAPIGEPIVWTPNPKPDIACDCGRTIAARVYWRHAEKCSAAKPAA